MQDNNLQSKTQRKRDADALQKLGKELIALAESNWKQMCLPEILIEALQEAKHINSHNAQKRHLQYIGKLMRDIDPEKIQQFFKTLRVEKNYEVEKHHQLEELRDTLISGGEESVNSFIKDYPASNKKQLNHFVRQANREREAGHPPKSARALFQYLKTII
jgi:ribosome-associated protein